MLLLYTAVIVLNAFLLFLIQPIFAKMALPLLGGSPAVWTTCMLFFQTLLFLGYVYSHASVRLLGIKRHALLHGALALLPILLLPVAIPSDPPAEGAPIGWLLGVMTLTVGAPFLVLSATAPLVQVWFSVARPRSDPYFLYSASNAGSLAALLGYPFVVEPLLSLRTQRVCWAVGYAMVAALLLASAVVVQRSDEPRGATDVASSPSPTWRRRFYWLALAFVPSALMLAVTTHISTDIAAVPLLWIVPLALYLSTFIIAFSQSSARVVGEASRLLPLVLLPVVLLFVAHMTASLSIVIPLHLFAFWLISLLCHAHLAGDRPPARHLTGFYVWIAAGGMLGGLFNTLVAPLMFTGVTEYPVLVAAGCFVLAGSAPVFTSFRRPRQLFRPLLAAVLAGVIMAIAVKINVDAALALALLGPSALFLFSVSRQPAPFAVGVALLLAIGIATPDRGLENVLYSQRTFFGIYRVTADAGQRLISLFHGSTLHGAQRTAQVADRGEPLSYYHRGSPIADVIGSLEQRGIESAGVIGLGVGSLAPYARQGQRWTFYEIDPVVERIARDNRYFTFLDACADTCRVVLGDGRLSLEGSAERHDLLVLDAFSSDAIPVHLLTREALQTYMAHLSDDGILAFHISNRHFDLLPALARLAADQRLTSVSRYDTVRDEEASGFRTSHWLAMARQVVLLNDLTEQRGWTPVTGDGQRVWTDDFSNIWSALRW